MIPNSAKESHIAVCPIEPILCKQCNQKFERSAYKKRHQFSCPEAIINCPYEEFGCTAKYRRADEKNHFNSCSFEKVKGLVSRCRKLTEENELMKSQIRSVYLTYDLKTILDRQTSEVLLLGQKWKVGVRIAKDGGHRIGIFFRPEPQKNVTVIGSVTFLNQINKRNSLHSNVFETKFSVGDTKLKGTWFEYNWDEFIDVLNGFVLRGKVICKISIYE
jgi:hypothetical protein